MEDVFAVGQIRKVKFTEDLEVLIIRKWEDKIWLVVPISHQDPNKPGLGWELVVPGFQPVVQVWNGRTLPEEFLLEQVGAACQEIVDVVMEGFRRNFYGLLPDESLAKCMRSILPDSERSEYLDREMSKWLRVDLEIDDILGLIEKVKKK